MQKKVETILQGIRQSGDTTVRRALRQWDGVDLPPKKWRVTSKQVDKAYASISPDIKKALKSASRRIFLFHQEEKKHIGKSWRKTIQGISVGQQVSPVSSVGLYVPGGRFAYPSTVLMTAIPAIAAGVKRIVMTTPPRHLTNEVLVAAKLSGVHEIYQLGGVAAVGALAYGTKTVSPVDLIVGPGGAWVTEAKRQVFGQVGIDLLAGPSEIVLLADSSAPADFVAADMMAQSEHDPLARATVVSTEKRVLAKIQKAVDKKWLKQCRFLKAKDWKEALAHANRLAPEHLSLIVKNPEKLLSGVKNAGAVFLGAWSPVAAGDYWAGPSHVLPTGQTARFSSGLSVQTFLKRSSLIGIPEKSFGPVAEGASCIAEAEGLLQHAASLKIRNEKRKKRG